MNRCLLRAELDATRTDRFRAAVDNLLNRTPETMRDLSAADLERLIAVLEGLEAKPPRTPIEDDVAHGRGAWPRSASAPKEGA